LILLETLSKTVLKEQSSTSIKFTSVTILIQQTFYRKIILKNHWTYQVIWRKFFKFESFYDAHEICKQGLLWEREGHGVTSSTPPTLSLWSSHFCMQVLFESKHHFNYLLLFFLIEYKISTNLSFIRTWSEARQWHRLND
jgi:hypothetical protein